MLLRCKFCRILQKKNKTVKFRFISSTTAIVMCDKCFERWENLEKDNPSAITEQDRKSIVDQIIKQLQNDSNKD